jgi:hypothetical protein
MERRCVTCAKRAPDCGGTPGDCAIWVVRKVVAGGKVVTRHRWPVKPRCPACGDYIGAGFGSCRNLACGGVER